MLHTSSKWELGLVHHIAKFTPSRFVISRFECSSKPKKIKSKIKYRVYIIILPEFKKVNHDLLGQ